MFVEFTFIYISTTYQNILFFRSDCDKIWNAFEQAYVGRDPCDVPMEAYDQVITVAPFTPRCNKVKLTHHETNQRAHCASLMPNNASGNVSCVRWCSGAKQRIWSNTWLRREIVSWLSKTLCWGLCWMVWPGVERKAAKVKLSRRLNNWVELSAAK